MMAKKHSTDVGEVDGSDPLQSSYVLATPLSWLMRTVTKRKTHACAPRDAPPVYARIKN